MSSGQLREGAHWSPWPTVPRPMTTVGRSPAPRQGVVGSTTYPVTGVFSPHWLTVLYMIFCTVDGAEATILGSSPASRGV